VTIVAAFAGLKLRLLRNGMRGNGARTATFWAGAAFGVIAGLILFAVLAAGPPAGEDRLTVVVLTFVALWVGWATIPLLAFGTDETLDPAHLALLPLTRGQTIAGLTVASAVGVVPVACLLGLTGTVVGYGTTAGAMAIIAAVVVLLLALCIATSRALTTALSSALRSRRWRDVTMVVVSLLGLLVGWGRFLVGDLVERVGDDVPAQAAEVLQWTPPGLLARAVADAADGAVAAPVAVLAAVGWILVLVLAGWWLALDRLSRTASTAVASRRTASSLFPRAIPFLPRTRAGAVAAKDLRYLARDPRGRSQLVSGLPLALGLPIFWAATSDTGGEGVLLATTTAMFMGLNQMNMFGIDGEALWMNVAAGFLPKEDLAGKAITAATVSAGATVVSAVALAALTGGWRWLPLALSLGLGVVGVMVGIGSVFSVRFPLPMADARGNLFASRQPGAGCSTSLILLGGYLLEVVLFAPMAALVAFGLASWPPALVMAGLLAPAYGWLVWRAGLNTAAASAGERWPELLAGVTPKRG